MFSENEKISLRQLKRLLVFDLFSISGLIIPRIATAASGRDGLIAIILATLFAFIYAWIILSFTKSINGNFLDFSKKNSGSVITFIIGLLLIIKLFACCVFAIRLFGEVINLTLLEDTDRRIIILLLLLVSAYAASKGFEVRARITEVLYFIVIVPIFLFLVFGLKDIDYSNLMPLFTEKTGNIITGGYEVFLTFSLLELLLFTAPLIHYDKSEIKKRNSLFHYVSGALLIVCVLNLLFFVVTVGILGTEETQQKLWSTVTIIQIIKMPGGFVQRQDAIILGIWMLSIFTLISGFLYYISLITKQIFRIPLQNYLLLPFILFLFGASVVPIKTEQYFYYFEKYMMYIGMPQSILLPVFIIFLSKLKSIKKHKNTLKAVLLITTFASVVSLTGCSDMTEIEDRNFVQSMGIDLSGEELIVYYELPDLKALTGQSSGDSEKLIVKLKGTDFWQIEDQYQLQSNKCLDFSQIKAFVIGKNLAEDSDKLEEFQMYVENRYEIGRNTLIFLSETDANEIISLSGELAGGIGDYLNRSYRINLLNTGKEEVTVGNMIQGKNNKNTIIRIPVIKASEKTLETIGLGIFSQNELVYQVNEEEADYINIANGHGKNNRLLLKKNQDDDPEYVIKINNISRKLDYMWDNEKPYLLIKIQGDATIEKGINNYGQTSKDDKNKLIEKIESECNKQIKSRITKSFEDIMKDDKVDFLNLYRLTSYKNRTMWLKYKDKANLFLSDLEYLIEVDIKMN